jgi:hypothetical protein
MGLQRNASEIKEDERSVSVMLLKNIFLRNSPKLRPAPAHNMPRLKAAEGNNSGVKAFLDKCPGECVGIGRGYRWAIVRMESAQIGHLAGAFEHVSSVQKGPASMGSAAIKSIQSVVKGLGLLWP